MKFIAKWFNSAVVLLMLFLSGFVSHAQGKEEFVMLVNALSYQIVETGQEKFYSDINEITKPGLNDVFYGQDANYSGNQPSYTNNSDGTITDNVTGLMWEQNMGAKMTYNEAFVKAEASTLAGNTDWRVPTIKELYSLILFTGKVKGETAIDMFINTDYFDQPLGDVSIGER